MKTKTRLAAILLVVVMVASFVVAPVSAFARPWGGGGNWNGGHWGGGWNSHDLDVTLSDEVLNLKCCCAATGNTADVTIDSVVRRHRPVDRWVWEVYSTHSCVADAVPDVGQSSDGNTIHIVAGCEGTATLTVFVGEVDRRGHPTGNYGFEEITVNVVCDCVFENPKIEGPSGAIVDEGYDAFSVGPYVLIGIPAPAINVLTTIPEFSFNLATNKIDIAAGLEPGVYEFIFEASNDQTCCECVCEPDGPQGPDVPNGPIPTDAAQKIVTSDPFTFTLTVLEKDVPPKDDTIPKAGDTLSVFAPSIFMLLGLFLTNEWRKRR